MEIKNSLIWITGASSGIGEALAHVLAKEGARLILSARRIEELERVKAALGIDSCWLLPLDLAQEASLQEASLHVRKHIGSVDALVHCGGISQRGTFAETELPVVKRIFDINFFGTIALTKFVLPDMLERQKGMLVVVTSVVGKYGTPFRTAYAASKHALHGFFDALRAEHWKDGLQVLLVAPGYVRTNLSFNAVMGDGSPQGKMDKGQEGGLSPEDCAQQIVKGMKAGRREIYPGGFKEVAGVYLKRFFPGLFSKIVRKVNVK